MRFSEIEYIDDNQILKKKRRKNRKQCSLCLFEQKSSSVKTLDFFFQKEYFLTKFAFMRYMSVFVTRSKRQTDKHTNLSS